MCLWGNVLELGHLSQNIQFCALLLGVSYSVGHLEIIVTVDGLFGFCVWCSQTSNAEGGVSVIPSFPLALSSF